MSSDAELFQAFAICYSSDALGTFMRCLEGNADLEEYLGELRRHQYIYPENAVKLRYVENHDLRRFPRLVKNRGLLEAWTCFTFFLPGTTLIFGGQEIMSMARVESADGIPRIDWEAGDPRHPELVRKLAAMKKHPAFSQGAFTIHRAGRKGVAFATIEWKGEVRAGIFNLEGRAGAIRTELADGTWPSLIGGTDVVVRSGEVELEDGAQLFAATARG